MSSENKDTSLTRYLLGQLREDEEKRLEEDYFADDSLYEELCAAERELTDRYVYKELTDAERRQYEERFLRSPARRRRLRFATALRRYQSDSVTEHAVEAKTASLPASWWRRYSQPLRVAACVVALFGLGLGVWRVFFHESEVGRGVIALRRAYRSQRLFRARITGFDYTPVSATRGGGAAVDRQQESLAEKLLLEAAAERPGYESHHALGQLYLARGQFEQAIAEFEEALKANPSDAQLHSDAGAALLEKGRAGSSGVRGEAAVGDYAKGLEHFNKAMELDPSLLEPLFNRALCYESMLLPELAKVDWRKYIERDPHSGWGEEAKRRLQELEEEENASRTQPDRFKEFLTAYRAGLDRQAWEAVSRSQSGSGNAVVEKLLDDYLSQSASGAGDEAEATLRMLSGVGRLVTEATGDGLFSEVSRFYALATPGQRATASEARRLMRSGHQKFNQARLGEAAELYRKAQRIFERIGNGGEARFARYRVGHCYLRQPDIRASIALFEELARECERSNAKWLLARVLNSIGDAYFSENRYSDALDHGKRSLALAEAARDDGTMIRNALQLSFQYNAVAKHEESLRYLQQGIDLAGKQQADANQLRLIYEVAANSFTSMGYYSAAVAYQRESLRLSKNASNPLLESRAYANLALIYGKMKKYDEAMESAHLSFDIGKSLGDQPVGRDMMAFASLQLGDLYRLSGDCVKALASYDENIRIYEDLSFRPLRFAASKGKLLCYLARRDDASAERELQVALSLFEQYRGKILEESSRNTFFDSEHDIYDVAIDFAHSRAHSPRRAFEYSEASRARSLLDLSGGGGSLSEKEYGPDLLLPTAASALSLSEIQEKLPPQARILQYAVLPDRLVIWVISKTEFSSREVNVSLNELSRKVERYWQLVSNPSSARQEIERSSRDLYGLLIAPVEPLLVKGTYVCVVPDKVLNYLPFNALLSPGSGRHLISDYVLGSAPSSSIFIKSCEAGRGKEGPQVERMLSIGNPDFERGAFPSLPDLPSAAEEARRVAGLYAEAHCLLEGAAVERRVRSEAVGADVIHLAAHYVADEYSPLLSKLLLAAGREGDAARAEADGVLQAWEVYEIKLTRTRLVVLSACQTGVERIYKGEGAVGIARPFIAAGVPVVVASLWPVDSDATAELMVNFHKLRRGRRLSSAEALRGAQLAMLDGPDRRLSHPYFWAPFTATGGHTTF